MSRRTDPWDGLVRPAYDGGSIVNLAVSVARAACLEPGPGAPLAPPLYRGLDPFQGRRADGPIVLLILDGFGDGDLRRWAAGGSPTAARWAATSRPLTTVFPSTTTAALTSLSTGVPPGRHGLVGYRQYLPRYGVVADMLKMSTAGWPGQDLLIGPNWRPEDVTGAPTLFRRGLRGTALTRDRFRSTGFTRLLYDGAEFVGYATATDLAQELLTILLRRRPPEVIYAYWDELDTVHHLKGPTPSLASLELERFAGLLGFVADHLPPVRRRRTTLVVTGDHGQVPSSRAGQISLDMVPGLLEHLARPLSGDRRAGFIAVRPGHEPIVNRLLHRHLPAGHRLIPMAEARAAGVFGPPPFHPEIEARTGDLLALVPSPHGLTYLPPGAERPRRHLFGAHGGLEAEEMLVPRVVLPFDDLSNPASQR
ncbi:MAG: alkaline phosphatase family protein [Thermoplasmata archaeon]|nr:alkaline phosphatase family protein [Thermoplasmata archaeon]